MKKWLNIMESASLKTREVTQDHERAVKLIQKMLAPKIADVRDRGTDGAAWQRPSGADGGPTDIDSMDFEIEDLQDWMKILRAIAAGREDKSAQYYWSMDTVIRDWISLNDFSGDDKRVLADMLGYEFTESTKESTVSEKKKSPAGGPACWKGKKIHPTKPTKMKGGKRVNNCIDAGTSESFDPSAEPTEYDELMDIYHQIGEQGLADALGLSPEQLDREISELAHELDKHADDDRDELINQIIDDTVSNADTNEDVTEGAETPVLVDVIKKSTETFEVSAMGLDDAREKAERMGYEVVDARYKDTSDEEYYPELSESSDCDGCPCCGDGPCNCDADCEDCDCGGTGKSKIDEGLSDAINSFIGYMSAVKNRKHVKAVQKAMASDPEFADIVKNGFTKAGKWRPGYRLKFETYVRKTMSPEVAKKLGFTRDEKIDNPNYLKDRGGFHGFMNKLIRLPVPDYRMYLKTGKKIGDPKQAGKKLADITKSHNNRAMEEGKVGQIEGVPLKWSYPSTQFGGFVVNVSPKVVQTYKKVYGQPNYEKHNYYGDPNVTTLAFNFGRPYDGQKFAHEFDAMQQKLGENVHEENAMNEMEQLRKLAGLPEADIEEGRAVTWTSDAKPDKEYLWATIIDGKEEGTYHSLEQAKRVVTNLKRVAPYRKYSIKRMKRTGAYTHESADTETCKACSGKGHKPAAGGMDRDCEKCDGTGKPKKDKVDENKLLKVSKLSSAEYQKAKKLKGFDKSEYKWDAEQQLYLKESYPMAPYGEPDDETNVSFNQTKKIGDATLNIHATAKDMAELQKVLQMAGLDPEGAEKHMPEPDSVKVTSVEPVSPCDGNDDISYSTDKTELIDMLRNKLQQKLN